MPERTLEADNSGYNNHNIGNENNIKICIVRPNILIAINSLFMRGRSLGPTFRSWGRAQEGCMVSLAK